MKDLKSDGLLKLHPCKLTWRQRSVDRLGILEKMRVSQLTHKNLTPSYSIHIWVSSFLFPLEPREYTRGLHGNQPYLTLCVWSGVERQHKWIMPQDAILTHHNIFEASVIRFGCEKADTKYMRNDWHRLSYGRTFDLKLRTATTTTTITTVHAAYK